MGYAERGNEGEAVERLKVLLPELEAGRFKLWPYCDEAPYFPLMLGYRCLAFAAANLGDDREAQRLAHHSIAQADRIGAPFFRLAGLLVLATTGISLGEHHQAEAYARENLGSYVRMGSRYTFLWQSC